jgi:hypothetical protein
VSGSGVGSVSYSFDVERTATYYKPVKVGELRSVLVKVR